MDDPFGTFRDQSRFAADRRSPDLCESQIFLPVENRLPPFLHKSCACTLIGQSSGRCLMMEIHAKSARNPIDFWTDLHIRKAKYT